MLSCFIAIAFFVFEKSVKKISNINLYLILKYS